ncbi:ATP-binding cassette domain-containing protein [Paenibacillus sacheonensis]|uniref:ATP-binding cassette domain-containing protein n=1 Tax=Paenibacillus sacheonensis TaxID=742054 RepID=A0A7X4YUQ9_9BACL|nr:ATP-binding cassette domain-containing protein [Paenibacillus sacheonensis]
MIESHETEPPGADLPKTSAPRTPEQPAVLSVRGLGFGFAGETPLFEKLDFSLKQGEFVSVLAASGIGKTTLFRLLSGLLVPQAGTIAIGEAGDAPAAASKLGKIGYMPQKDCLMPWRTVLDNAVLGLELGGMPKREARRQVLKLLPGLGLDGTANKYPHELSGGMRQRVSFLRSLLGGGELLLLDEPFSALDAMTRVGMQEWLLQVWEQHRTTVLFITHDVDEALLLSDRVLVAAQSPITSLNELAVDLPRPRSYEFAMDEAFIDLKRRLLGLIGRGARGSSEEAGRLP